MAPDTKKSPKASRPSSSSKPAKKRVSILGSMLNSAFTKDSSSISIPKVAKNAEGKDSKDQPKEAKSSSSKQSSKRVKPKSSKHATEATTSSSSKPRSKVPSSKLSEVTTVQSEMFLSSAFFKDESQPPTPIQSTTPELTTAFTSEHDKKMATRQLQIDTLSETELQEQEEWAQTKLVESWTCPMGRGWQRYIAPEGYSQFDGYRCYGGASTHLVSHQLLAEGKNSLYRLSDSTGWWEGPFDAEELRQELEELLEGGPQLPLADEARQLTPEQFRQLLRSFFSLH
ncbi:hypothetical protein DL98DRAFT_635472 [Cadophora sp. DSE1049]|nr:hypothetical protein DL98DRAFT_635472 [Cadophora sp. DSE1049]